MKRKLLDTVQEQESKEAESKEAEAKKPKRTIDKIIVKDGAKDKQISAKVNRKMYDAFTTINRMQGLSNNSALNMIIAKYVRENKTLLDEENLIY